jgi:hypothetical protein
MIQEIQVIGEARFRMQDKNGKRRFDPPSFLKKD